LDQELPHPIDKVGEIRQIHHLRTNILALEHPPRPGPSAVVDNDKRQRHVEKQTSPDLKNGEKTKLSIYEINEHTLPSTPRRRCEDRRRCGSEVETDLFARTPLSPPQRDNDAPQQKNPNPIYKTEERGPLSLLPPERQGEEEGTSFLAGGDVRERSRRRL
jgi:hypothetical protein